jgi:hypothetical protein
MRPGRRPGGHAVAVTVTWLLLMLEGAFIRFSTFPFSITSSGFAPGDDDLVEFG